MDFILLRNVLCVEEVQPCDLTHTSVECPVLLGKQTC